MSRGEDNDILMISVVSLSRDVEIYLSAVFFCLAAALPHHNIRSSFKTRFSHSLPQSVVYLIGYTHD